MKDVTHTLGSSMLDGRRRRRCEINLNFDVRKLLKNQNHVALTVICVVRLGSVTQSSCCSGRVGSEDQDVTRICKSRGKQMDKEQVWFSLTGFPRKLEGTQMTLRAGRRESGTFHSFHFLYMDFSLLSKSIFIISSQTEPRAHVEQL